MYENPKILSIFSRILKKEILNQGLRAAYLLFLTILSHKSALKYKFTKSFFEKILVEWPDTPHHNRGILPSLAAPLIWKEAYDTS